MLNWQGTHVQLGGGEEECGTQTRVRLRACVCVASAAAFQEHCLPWQLPPDPPGVEGGGSSLQALGLPEQGPVRKTH